MQNPPRPKSGAYERSGKDYTRDSEAFWRDLVIAFWHPRYADTKPLEAMADLKRRRHA